LHDHGADAVLLDSASRLKHGVARIDAWWPKINALVRTAITNACTEAYNRLVKQVERQLRIPEARALRAKYDSTAPANSGPQPRFHADCPVKIEEPVAPVVGRLMKERRAWRQITCCGDGMPLPESAAG
jgi:hypothetical protein